MPHGGPHSAFTAVWFVSVVFLAATGRAVLLTNYTGCVQRCAWRALLG
jgi:dipeptidyl aminopeptidase/acylaminoacyl peptidase